MGMASHRRALLLLFPLSVLLRSAAADDGAVMANLASSLSPAPSDWTGTAFCSWTGIGCDNSNRVTSISLPSRSIAGTLPADLNSLSQLKSLDLQGNCLSGALPSLANLPFLEEVFLDRNQFVSIPADFFAGLSNLLSMSLSDNPTLAPWTIPVDLTQSSSLNAFSAINASIVGSIPDIFNSFPNMQNLRLSYNSLTGSLPPSFAGSKISNLWLNNQMMGLSGTIEVLSSMSQLCQVWLQANSFTGGIPDLSKCTSLSDLQLQDNQFTGVVPTSLTSLPLLTTISLQNNKLQGPLPVFGFGVSITLGTTNKFCKTTPGPCDPQVTLLLEAAGALGYPMILAQSWEGNDACSGWSFISCEQGSITIVNLGKQCFSGTISPAFASITSLRSLLLNDNNLSGLIPDSLASLPNLQVLDVSNNKLSGPIPFFPSTVKLTTSGNPLLGKNCASGSGGSPGSGSNSATHCRIRSKGKSSGSPVSPDLILRVSIALTVSLTVTVGLTLSYKAYVKKLHVDISGGGPKRTAFSIQVTQPWMPFGHPPCPPPCEQPCKLHSPPPSPPPYELHFPPPCEQPCKLHSPPPSPPPCELHFPPPCEQPCKLHFPPPSPPPYELHFPPPCELHLPLESTIPESCLIC